MILDCPECHARYLVPAAHFAVGPRIVRCARCRHSWTADLPQQEADIAAQLARLAPASLEPPPAPGANLPALLADTQPFILRHWHLCFLAAVFAVFAIWFVADRREIAGNWPPVERFYDRIGFHIYHAGEGLSFEQVRSELQFDSGIMQLMVEGQVHNYSVKTRPIPDILATAVGADGQAMQSWQIPAPAATLDSAASLPFKSTIRAPDGAIAEIRLTFIEPQVESTESEPDAAEPEHAP